MHHNVLEYLEESSRKYPNKIAVTDGTVSYTYRELHMRAQVIGSNLYHKTGSCKPVAIYMDKSCDTLALFLGSVYAGAFYTLIDPGHPGARVEKILQISNVKVLIADKTTISEAEKVAFSGEIVLIDQLLMGQVDQESLDKVRNNFIDIDPLYVNFTSGSAGMPKGVIVNHRSVIDFIEYFTELFQITEYDTIGNQAPFDFDVSVKDIYSSLKSGATLCLIPRKLFSEPKALLDYLEEKQVTTLIWAVSALCIITMYKGFDYKIPAQINKVLFSGEVMPVKHLNTWMEKYPEAMFVNLYGPTEITCNCTYYILKRKYAIGESVPIGKGFPNERVFLLDVDDQIISEDSPYKSGEICVSGTAVTMGYFNDAERTDMAFVQHPGNKGYREYIYRTGDIAVYDEERELHFVNRKDFQIKHMGHRIELLEIESHIENMEGIDRVCCIYENNKIYAFYVGNADKKMISDYLIQKLPKYMIPNIMVKLESIPLTANGKIDRKKMIGLVNNKK